MWCHNLSHRPFGSKVTGLLGALPCSWPLCGGTFQTQVWGLKRITWKGRLSEMKPTAKCWLDTVSWQRGHIN
eukprot:4308391-Alexandrium_andersonii.AAC.1